MLIKLKRSWTSNKIETCLSIYFIFREIFLSLSPIDRNKEHFFVCGIKTNGKIKYIDLVGIGTTKAVHTEPREVFRYAISKGVSSIIVCHNHPSGNLEPSKCDVKMTQRLEECGKILDIPLWDHMIISERSYYSFKEISVKMDRTTLT